MPEYIEWIRGQLVQGGADGFIEDEIHMPPGRRELHCNILHHIEFDFENLDGVKFNSVADGDELTLQVTSSTNGAALKNLDDKEVLGQKKIKAFGIALQLVYLPMKIVWSPKLLYPRRTLYVSLDSIGATSAMTVNYRLCYTQRYVKQGEFNRAMMD